MPTKHLNYWMTNLNEDIVYVNLYGPTEITVDCTYFIVDRSFKDEEVLPIGKPCRNTDILILNKENELCGIEEKGELCVRGSSLALGYWNDLEKTNTVFCQNPLNNHYPEKIYRTGDTVFVDKNQDIVFAGRKDSQIKHLGRRIELGEIEHAVFTIFSSIMACALYDQNKGEIILFYGSKEEISILEFRRELNKIISNYMIPSRFIKLNNLPLTTNGKIDRVALNKN